MNDRDIILTGVGELIKDRLGLVEKAYRDKVPDVKIVNHVPQQGVQLSMDMEPVASALEKMTEALLEQGKAILEQGKMIGKLLEHLAKQPAIEFRPQFSPEFKPTFTMPLDNRETHIVSEDGTLIRVFKK